MTDVSKLQVESEKSVFNLNCISASEFPLTDENFNQNEFSIKSKQLLKLLNKCKFSVSNDETRHYLSGIFFHQTQTEDKNFLTAAATDIDLIDNNASALSFDASGKAGILEIVTTNSGEGVNMSGNLTVEGDFVVNGNTTNANVANLLVEDRFILLNSGSDSGDGGLIVQSGSTTAMSGAAFVFDQNVERWGVQTDVALGSIATTSAPEAYQVNYVLNANTGSATYNVKGNLKIDDSNGDIYIYS